MLQLRFDADAQVDYINALDYMRRTEGIEKAVLLDQELQARIKLCQSNPHHYKTVLGDARRISLKHFYKYYVTFILLDECIYIVAIGHASRREFFWKNRLRTQIK